MRRPDLVINQVYRPGNIGDAAIIESMLALVRRVGSEISIGLATKYPDSVAAYYGKRAETVFQPIFGIPDGGNGLVRAAKAVVQAARAYPPDSMARDPFRDAKAVIDAGGGSLFSSSRRGPSIGLWQHLYTLNAAKDMGCWTGIAAQTIGPITKRSDERALRAVLQRLDKIHVRDDESRRYLREFGIESQLVPDLAWSKAYLSSDVKSQSSERSSPTIGVTVMDWRWAERKHAELDGRWRHYLLAVADGVGRVARNHAASVEVFPHVQAGHDNDLEASQVVLARLKASGVAARLADHPSTPAAAAAAYAGLEAMVCTRMHSAILALSHGVPVIAFAYQPKVRGMMRTLGLGDDVFDPGQADAEALAIRLTLALEDKGRRNQLLDLAEKQRKAATEEFCTMIGQAMQGGP